MHSHVARLGCALALSASLVACDSGGPTTAAPVAPVQAVADSGPTRSSEDQARDVYLHPEETFAFFGIDRTDAVLDVEPDGAWLIGALSPRLDAKPGYTAVVPMAASDFLARNAAAKWWNDGNVRSFSPVNPVLGPEGSMDVVVSLDNAAEWFQTKRIEPMFKAMFAVLKPGGTLAIIEPRSPQPVAQGDKSGYIAEKQVVFYAELAGFQLAEWSEMNANGKDTRNHPAGARSLPPHYEGVDSERARFQSIGEPDRMTLKFVKPAEPGGAAADANAEAAGDPAASEPAPAEEARPAGG